MQRNNTPILIGTILFGLLALGVTVVLFLKPSGPPQPEVAAGPTPTPVPAYAWVALRNIPPRVHVQLSDLEKRKVPAGKSTPDAVSDYTLVKDLVTKVPIPQGDPISMSQFEKPLARVMDASMEIPSGYRAVGIWVDPDQTAAGLVDVGDRIDVIATHRQTWDKGPNQFAVGALTFASGRTIATNLLVLGVKKSLDAPPPVPTTPPGAPGAVPGAAPPPAPPPTPAPAPNPGSGPQKTRVIVAAKPDIAAHLVAANETGNLHITIRNPDDADTNAAPEVREYPSRLITLLPASNKATFTPHATLPPLFPTPMPMPSQAPVGPMVPPPPAEKKITIIRGTEKTLAVIPNN